MVEGDAIVRRDDQWWSNTTEALHIWVRLLFSEASFY
ncbi:predicted protein [Sclerotinia sclerotiorum 1980 UF-70]|uniref:Uncharacterized protein n=1 Tax=Sclerotinia sclerotiorum (strain ATCC 18683 / 1980 / Ss-1) TaxID=665079 RepID=A7F4Q7_SCLS1|nr:predicted protein [Sclerotinia sclerotiorum 1980 UF-70]EDN97728.1 predicted protein [Sclerotinia sclerotiorum 1980 UF-70]